MDMLHENDEHQTMEDEDCIGWGLGLKIPEELYYQNPEHEKALDEALRSAGAGKYIGVMRAENQEDAIVFYRYMIDIWRGQLENALKALDGLYFIPKGSTIWYDGRDETFGQQELLRLHIPGYGALRYEEKDHIGDMLNECLKGAGFHWKAYAHDDLYFCGPSYEAMRAALAEELSKYDEFAGATMEQIA